MSNQGRKKKSFVALIEEDLRSSEVVVIMSILDNSLIFPKLQFSKGVLTRVRRAFLAGSSV